MKQLANLSANSLSSIPEWTGNQITLIRAERVWRQYQQSTTKHEIILFVERVYMAGYDIYSIYIMYIFVKSCLTDCRFPSPFFSLWPMGKLMNTVGITNGVPLSQSFLIFLNLALKKNALLIESVPVKIFQPGIPLIRLLCPWSLIFRRLKTATTFNWICNGVMNRFQLLNIQKFIVLKY